LFEFGAFSPPVPDLTKDDFNLIGGRLEVIHQQPAADAKTELRELGGYHLLHWIQNNMSYWAVSDVDTTDLRQFADLIRGR